MIEFLLMVGVTFVLFSPAVLLFLPGMNVGRAYPMLNFLGMSALTLVFAGIEAGLTNSLLAVMCSTGLWLLMVLVSYSKQ